MFRRAGVRPTQNLLQNPRKYFLYRNLKKKRLVFWRDPLQISFWIWSGIHNSGRVFWKFFFCNDGMSGENAYGQNSRSFTMEGWKSKCENEKDVYLLQPLFTKLAISKIYKEYERSCSPNITLQTLKSKKMKWKRNKKSAILLVFLKEKTGPNL